MEVTPPNGRLRGGVGGGVDLSDVTVIRPLLLHPGSISHAEGQQISGSPPVRGVDGVRNAAVKLQTAKGGAPAPGVAGSPPALAQGQ